MIDKNTGTQDRLSLYLLRSSPYSNWNDLINAKQKKYQQNWFYKPVGIELEITSLCNIECSGCAVTDSFGDKNYTLSHDTIMNVLEQAAKYGLFFYTITGGEPFLAFDMIKQLLPSAPLDLMTLRTNGYAFSNLEKTKAILGELSLSIKNKYMKTSVYLSQGQQNIAGVPIINSIYMLTGALSMLDPDRFTLNFTLFDKNIKFAEEIDNEFFELLKKYDIPLDRILTDFTHIKDTRICSTAIKIGELSDQMTGIKTLIDLYKKQRTLNCSHCESQLQQGWIGPRMLVRANGDVYACSGFCHVFLLGNIHTQSLLEILEYANALPELKAVFTSGLEGLLDYTLHRYPQVAEEVLSISFGPCNLCEYLVNFLSQGKAYQL
ncbi:MAG: hypothetical protein DKM50_05430 [Candidatus Margulisiibacteriota bacterium]|nr:MAG: hypothetical protein A2X43_02880 [Candidatus Margulisbacteria bacterium GWD2_39_127]PZM80207.1 MAG: hypothetical protein DKM50_05430 [Candidatus Margulisiibacteriota bacterium]HAR64141.1 hypothetical protein [Candidatus Margulisiibacteriota bacterium]HCY36924.1 hypothetical protein [Candidatus Margulisiibacteriota bacterium]